MSAKRVRSTSEEGETRERTMAETVEGKTGKATLPNGLFAELCIGKPLHHRNLTVFPLSWAHPHEAPYILLGTAIEVGQAVVEEVSEAGSVPNLTVTNKADRPLLIPEGEILIGAKQNRVVNVTVLVAAGIKFVMPVSCVEAGRWRYQSRHFESKFSAPSSLRYKKMKAVQRNRAEGGRAESDQGEARPRQSALGLGEELEIAGNGLVGGALTYSGQLCHVAAFSESA